jgi:hypothetical protein
MPSVNDIPGGGQPPELTFLIFAHNSAAVIENTLESVGKRFHDERVEILVVQNGSVDGTQDILARIAGRWGDGWPTLRVVESAKGLGNAVRTGFAASTGRVVVASPDDLPFGFDDLEGAQRLGFGPRQVVVGSKGHPDSDLGDRSWVRTIMTAGFRALRLVILGMRIADPQGTYVVDGDWARATTPALKETGFLITTEIAYAAILSGIRPVEVPVRLRESHHRTRIAPRDVLQMGLGLLSLRARRRALRAELRTLGSVASDTQTLPAGDVSEHPVHSS